MLQTIINILAVVGCIGLVILSFPIYFWIDQKREDRRLRSFTYWEEFAKIARWHGIADVEKYAEEYENVCLNFTVIYFLNMFVDDKFVSIQKTTNFYAFDPMGFPEEVRPKEWFVHFCDKDDEKNVDKHRILLCHLEQKKPNWKIEKSGRHWFNDAKAEIILQDRCNCTKEITRDADEYGHLDWNQLIEEAYEIMMHGNSVDHYELRKLEDELKK